MQFLRKAALTAAASLLTLSLFSFGLGWSLFQVFGHPGPIKQALASSGIYGQVISEADAQRQKDQPQPSGGDIPTNDPAVQAIFKQAFPANFLQSQTENVLDAVYGWIDGSRPALSFAVDLSSAKTRLADGIGQYASSRLSSLPTCTAGTIPSGDIDVFNATCLPPGFDQAAAAAQARDKILNGDFLKNATITPDTKAGNGKTVSQQLQKAPENYKKIKRGLLGDVVLAVLLAGAVVALAVTWRVGVRKVSVMLLTVGATSTVFSLLSMFIARRVVQKLDSSANTDSLVRHSIAPLGQHLANEVDSHWLTYGITLLVLGVGALVALRLTRPRNPIDITPKKPSKYVHSAPDVVDEGTPEPEPEPDANKKDTAHNHKQVSS